MLSRLSAGLKALSNAINALMLVTKRDIIGRDLSNTVLVNTFTNLNQQRILLHGEKEMLEFSSPSLPREITPSIAVMHLKESKVFPTK